MSTSLFIVSLFFFPYRTDDSFYDKIPIKRRRKGQSYMIEITRLLACVAYHYIYLIVCVQPRTSRAYKNMILKEKFLLRPACVCVCFYSSYSLYSKQQHRKEEEGRKIKSLYKSKTRIASAYGRMRRILSLYIFRYNQWAEKKQNYEKLHSYIIQELNKLQNCCTLSTATDSFKCHQNVLVPQLIFLYIVCDDAINFKIILDRFLQEGRLAQ